jgi:hypothetical protein
MKKILPVPNAKILNFELLYLNENNYSDQKIADVNFRLVSADIKNAAKEGCDTIFGLLLLDGFLYKNNTLFFDWLRSIEKLCYQENIHNLILVPGMCEDFKNVLEQQEITANIEFFDFTHRMVYNSYCNKLDTLPRWNKDATDFLFLGGIPSRPNRIRLLSKFYQKTGLKNCKWSFFKPVSDEDKSICRLLMKDFSNEEYRDFVDSCENSVDDLYIETQEYSRLTGPDIIKTNIYSKPWLKDPVWIDTSIFENTKFSIVSEGNAYPPATSYKFLTEKTWRAVANRHPFIIAGHADQIYYAHRRGLCTFENYMDSDFYNSPEEEKFDAIVRNATEWLDNLNFHEVNNDVEKNYQRFLEIAQEQNYWLQTLNEEYQVPLVEINKWFNQLGFSHLIRVPDGF